MPELFVKTKNKIIVKIIVFSISLVTLSFGSLFTGVNPVKSSGLGAPNTETPSIQFSNPSALQVSISEGDDYAKNVLRNAWDMDSAQDMGYQVGFKNVNVSNGLWEGIYSGKDLATNTKSTGYIFPLFQGFSKPVGSYLSQQLDWNNVGSRDELAIDTNKYTLLSYRIYTSDRSQYFVQWTSEKPVYWPTGDYRFGGNDGCYTSADINYWPAGWRTSYFDLTKTNGEEAVRSGSWQDFPLVRGLRIDPSVNAPIGTEIKVDWIRLTDPSSSPIVRIEWNVAGVSQEDVVDIYVSENPDGLGEAAPLIRGVPASQGFYDLKTSILPPGQHYFMLRLMTSELVQLQDGSWINPYACGSVGIIASTEWAGPLTINPATTATFFSPSMISGADYATIELDNPWDMNSNEDIITPGAESNYPQTTANNSFSDGIFAAKSIINPGDAESDAQIWLNVDPNNPIDSDLYRYFSIHMNVNKPSDKDINWLIKNGWGARVVWWNNAIDIDGSTLKYGTLYDNWQTYSVDLARATPSKPISDPSQVDNILHSFEENSFPAQLGWTNMESVLNLRFDPLETTPEAEGTGAEWFYIDWVKLTAISRIEQGEPFPVQISLNRPPEDGQDITFYYTTDPENEKTQHLILETSIAQPSSGVAKDKPSNLIFLPLTISNSNNSNEDTNSYSPTPIEGVENEVLLWWDTSDVSPNEYYICTVISDEYNETSFCSEVPMQVY